MSSMRELSRCLRQVPAPSFSRPAYQVVLRRWASSQAAAQAAPARLRTELEDLEPNGSTFDNNYGQGIEPMKSIRRSRLLKNELPSSRYQYHPPRYDRGPLHPIQSPLSSDPVARDFVPGPFNLPRLKQTFDTTIASDFLTLTYQHHGPGEIPETTNWAQERRREWDGSSPYHKNRPPKEPRGSDRYTVEEHVLNFNNIPRIRNITIATNVPGAAQNALSLYVARTVLQAISGGVPETTKYKKGVASWGLIKGRPSGAKVTMHDNLAYEFLDKLVHIVLPRIKEWPGLDGSTGDNRGNIAFGFTPAHMVLFPEIETNLSIFPPKLVPGCRIFIKTTARSNRHARLLLQSLGVPFHGHMD